MSDEAIQSLVGDAAAAIFKKVKQAGKNRRRTMKEVASEMNYRLSFQRQECAYSVQFVRRARGALFLQIPQLVVPPDYRGIKILRK